jgi:hypothetical protein
MRQPPGFEDGTDQVVRLLRGLYGLKQSARLWNKNMTSKMESIGYHQLKNDNAVFMRTRDADVCIIAIHVDNYLSFGNTADALKRARDELHLTFEMKAEDPTWLMGFHLVDNKPLRTTTMSHRQYIETTVRRFHLDNAHPISTPMEPGTKLTDSDSPDASNENDMKGTPYREIVGSALWTSLVCTPQITYAVCQVARFGNNPGRPHWEAAKRIVKYLKGKSNYGLVLGGKGDNALRLTAYSDASWAEDINDRRSVSGYVVKLGDSTISWGTKRQTTVATSSTEAEYIAAGYCARHIIWLQQLLDELGANPENAPTTLYMDCKGAIDLTKDSRHHQRTKHIDVAHHYIRERVEDGSIVVEQIPSAEMLSDGLTKALPRISFEKLEKGLGLVDLRMSE